MGQKCRSALIAQIYKKCFQLNSKSKQTCTTAEIVKILFFNFFKQKKKKKKSEINFEK